MILLIALLSLCNNEATVSKWETLRGIVTFTPSIGWRTNYMWKSEGKF